MWPVDEVLRHNVSIISWWIVQSAARIKDPQFTTSLKWPFWLPSRKGLPASEAYTKEISVRWRTQRYLLMTSPEYLDPTIPEVSMPALVSPINQYVGFSLKPGWLRLLSLVTKRVLVTRIKIKQLENHKMQYVLSVMLHNLIKNVIPVQRHNSWGKLTDVWD